MQCFFCNSRVLLFAIVIPLASYSSVIYDFTGITSKILPFPPSAEEFTLVVPGLLNPVSPVQFTCGQLQSSANCGGLVVFSTAQGGGEFAAQLEFADKANGAFVAYDFPTGAFSALGSYLTEFYGDQNSNQGSLQVTTQTGSAVPEPGSFYLPGAGLVCVAVLCYRRRRKRFLGYQPPRAPFESLCLPPVRGPR